MHKRLSLLVRSALYALRGGFLVRPLVIALLLGAAGAILSFAEEYAPALNAWIPEVLFPSHQDPQVAQTILAGIASSTMTVVSIIFAILLMTLTLASTQFSPRILVSFVRDRSTQWTLGIFLGTYCFCMAALPAVRSHPRPFVPVATVMTAMILALLCVSWLIFFIHHISQSISVNQIVDRIARETELVIDDLMPHPRGPAEQPEHGGPFRKARERLIVSRRSGYIRFVDVPFLVERAKNYGVQIVLERRVGHFVPSGVPIMRVLESGRVTPDREAELLSAFDIGPARTMQQDVEFGIIQIVDVALRAISPAINDPSTAISCIDQLSRVLIKWAGRSPPRTYLHGPPHVLRVVMPWIDFDGLLDTAFEQIRHYAKADIAVSLRLLRAFDDIASTGVPPQELQSLFRCGRRVIEGCEETLPEADLSRLRERLKRLEGRSFAHDLREV
ncbi:Uncharacterized membrane protein [Methylocapsa palsarum]|uniref:Uncharacterized membrane protein n=2 Tax=Methylocapsa palsarum TaxID=1612308 RepID=A0A1I4D5C6_9HYPH|nr:DUF2254 domain-containing protein [Methylocapsa palsarum]SFK88000.1 Uncharacterized membrane protein [Methylocapsa palsarum]